MNPHDLLQQGTRLHEQGQWIEADAIYRRVLQLVPNSSHVHQLLGVIALQSGHAIESVRWLQQAIQLDHRQAEYFSNLGLALIQLRRYDEATVACHQAIQLQPHNPAFYFNLGIAYQANKQITEAFSAYEKAHQLAPKALDLLGSWIHIKQHLCDWENLEELCKPLMEAFHSPLPPESSDEVSPFGFLALPVPTTPRQQLYCAMKWVQLGSAKDTIHQAAQLTSDRSRIRLGYMSADLRDHPVGWLLSGILKHHDRTQFEIYGYSLGPSEDTPIYQELTQAFDHRRELLGINGRDAVAQIIADDIDILIDLQGHTQEARLDILSARPAPVQLNFLGYPGTMGASYIDYMIADCFVIPDDLQTCYTERLVMMPHCYLPPSIELDTADIRISRADVALSENTIVLCAFSSYYKITAPVFDAWLTVLEALPDCILWLREGHAEGMKRLVRRASQFGIQPHRLVFAPHAPRPMHLARQRLADVFLDTFPYNQHSAAADALRMGVPVVSLTGDSFASRVSGSLLNALQLNELITHSLPEYVQTIQRLAQTPELRAAIKARLRQAIDTSPVFSPQVYTGALELGFRAMKRCSLGEHEASPIFISDEDSLDG